jgi:hypothetical protein
MVFLWYNPSNKVQKRLYSKIHPSSHKQYNKNSLLYNDHLYIVEYILPLFLET